MRSSTWVGTYPDKRYADIQFLVGLAGLIRVSEESLVQLYNLE